MLHPGALAGLDPLAIARMSGYLGVVERINYDNAVNGRFAVLGHGGNDVFAVDDNVAVATLDGGAGNDSFQIGQVYGMRRDDAHSGLSPPDWFATVATTRGYLSVGSSAPIVAQGGSGNDSFTVYSNHAALRLEGNDGNDLFAVQAFALAQTRADGSIIMGPLFTGAVTINSGASTITRSGGGSFITDGFAVGQTLVVKGAGSSNDNTATTAYVISAVTASTIILARTLTTVPPLRTSGTFTSVSLSSGPLARSGITVAAGPTAGTSTITRSGGSFVTDGFIVGQTVALAGTGTSNDNLGGVPYVVTGVSALTLTVSSVLTTGTYADATVSGVLPSPMLTSGFSTAAQTDIRTGNGNNQVQYNINAPVSVDGGTGFNKLVVLGTEFADHIVVTATAIYGAGIQVNFRNIQVVEVDALQGDDTIDVLSTAPGVATRVLGGLGSDVINVAGDVVGDVVSRDPNGSSSTINHLVISSDADYNDIIAAGLNVSVARPSQGVVLISESGGFSSVRRLTGSSAIGSIDSYGVRLAKAPTSDVWITVSAAASPREQRPYDPLHPFDQSNPFGDTLYVCTTSAAVCATSAGYFHTVYDDLGVAHLVPNRAVVLLFTTANWQATQTVWFAAATDTLPQGTIVMAISHTVISADPVFAGAVVRNVEVTVLDNLTPDVVVTQLDNGAPDTGTTVIKGTTTTRLTDTFTVQPSSRPSGTVTYVLTPSDTRIVLSSSDARFSLGAVVAGAQTYRVTICVVCGAGISDWTVPVLITVTAVDNFLVQDPHHTMVAVTVDGTVSGRDASYDQVTGSLDVLVLDDNSPGVYVKQSGGSTVVSLPDGATPGTTDTYAVRLLKAPKAAVSVGIVTDGQTSIVTDPTCGSGILGKVCLAAVGRLAAKELFRGNVTISGATLTRAAGSELGSFVADGFTAGQKLLVTGAGGSSNTIATAYTIVAVTASTITLSAALPVGGTFAGVSLQRVFPAGLFTGAVTWDATAKVLSRNDGASWLDNGFLEGQLVQLSGVTGTFKIQSIFGANLEKMSFTVAPALTSGPVTMTQYAAVATFDQTNWWKPITVTVAADDAYVLPPGRGDLIVFPKRAHLLSDIRGPLQVDGGTGGLHRSLTSAVIAPDEINTPPFGIGQQPSEARQVDVLNIFNDGSHENLTGELTSTALTGFGMGPAITFPGTTAFGEPNAFPGGISYGTIRTNPDGTFSADGSVSTIESLNILLGEGNDTLTIRSTLVPGADTAEDDKLAAGIPALHGGLTTVHGGGNQLLAVTGSFTVASVGGVGRVTRTDGLAWTTAGFAVGSRVNLPGYAVGLFTVTGFADGGATLLLSGPAGSPALPVTTWTDATVSVYDPKSPETGYVRVGGDHIIVLGGGGPTSPLVIFGDTSQDGIWYSGDPTAQTGHLFGPKPTIEPVGNAPNYVFPVAAPFAHAGNDFIDASALFATVPSSQLPAIGVTIYGGAGQDTIIGSQAGDILAGGSGDDLILGQRGRDLIYGDSGVNVDVITRVLTVATANASSLQTADSLFAGHDVLIGEGFGSAPSTDPGQADNADVIFGDHGRVVQDVQDVRTWRLDESTGTFVPDDGVRLQRLQTTLALMHLAVVQPQNGVSDTIEGDLGNDLLFGGGGSDTIWGNAGNDLVFGDHGQVDCTQVWTDPGTTGCRIEPAALPFDVALNDHLFTWTSIYTGPTANWGNDLVTGDAGNDVLVGGAGSDRMTGGAGADDLIGGNTGLPVPGAVGGSGGAGGYNAGVDFSAGGVGYGDVYGGTGGTDGPHSACVGAGACTYGDYLDGGAGNDVIAGDNALILRTGTILSPRFRLLSGTTILSTVDGSAQTTGTNYDGTSTPCEWLDRTGSAATAAPSCTAYGFQQDPRGAAVRFVTLFDQSFTPDLSTFSDSSIAGGAGDDVLFGQLGNDWIQGDASVISDQGRVTVDVQTRDTVNDPRASVEDQAGPGTDGADYIEGNGGSDVIYGGLGQDDLVGGSSTMFGLVNRDQRPDGADSVYGGAGTRVGINDLGDLSATGHAHDADAILGDNGNLYRLVGASGSVTKDANGAAKVALAFLAFTYDNYSTVERIVPRAWTLLDYTYGTAAATDIGGADLVHGESGDDLVLGQVGNDVLFGDGQHDTVIGNTGNDRIYGGSGDDAIIGDDGYYKTSRNGLTEPLWDVTVAHVTNVLEAIPGPFTQALTYALGELFHEARLFVYPSTDATATGYADIVYGGLGNDWIHGNEGNDAISGAEALPFFYSDLQQSMISARWGINPADPLLYDPTTTKFADYNANDPWSKIYDCTDGTRDIGLTGTCAAGQKVDFFLNFTPFVLDAAGQPMRDAAGGYLKSDDGCDIIYGDVGNDWLVGGTDTNWLFGGFGDDLLQSSPYLEVDGGTNRRPVPERWSAPTFAYGGAGRDVLIAGTGRARMYDWGGEFNSFVVPFAPFGAPVVNRSFSPWIQDFIRALSVAGGMDMTFAPATPLDELSLSTPKDSFWKDQHGGPRDPQPGNVGGVQIDYRGLVDLGADCPCHPGIVIAVNGAVNAADPLHPTGIEDADVPPGRLLTPGGALALTYLVTNPGTTALQVLSITDDNATASTADDFHPTYVSGDTNGNQLLDAGEVWLYTAVGVAGAPQTALPGDHQHVVTVQGYDPVASTLVTAADPTNYSTSATLVSIRKDLNAVNILSPSVTEQADTMATAPRLAAGSPVRWTYRLTTSSLSPVTVVSVIDDNGTPGNAGDDWAPLPLTTVFGGSTFNVGDTNYDGLLGVGETWLYTSAGVAAAPTTAQVGWFTNIGRLEARGADGSTYRDSNPAIYLGTTGLGLVKAVNAVDPLHPTAAEDANTTGPTVAVGSTVRFTYVVSNTSAGPMTVTGLVDDNATPGNPADDVGLGSGIAAVLGTGGLNVGDTNANGVLDPGEGWLYAWSRVVGQQGGYTNTATVTAVNAAGLPVTGTDVANYSVAGGKVEIQTAVNAVLPLAPTGAEDADTPPGALLTVGQSAVFTYRVLNTGFVPLKVTGITDSNGFTPRAVTVTVGGVAYNTGDTNPDGLLGLSEVWLYTSAGVRSITAAAGLYTSISTVTAQACLSGAASCGGTALSSQDPTYFTAYTVGISVKKAVNAVNPLAPTATEDANDPANPRYLLNGTPLVFTYLVSRTTNVKIPASAIVLVDDNGTPLDPTDDFRPVYVSGDGNGSGTLDGSEVWLYTSAGLGTRRATEGAHVNVATVTAKVGSVTYGSTDVAWYRGFDIGVVVKKATNAVDPLHPSVLEEGDDTTHQLYLPIGTPVVWTYRVTNPGTAGVQVAAFVDDRGTASTADDFTPLQVLAAGTSFNTGDTNRNGLLDPGETWLYTSAGVAKAVYTVVGGQFTSSATVTAREPRSGATATSSDPSLHYGALNKIVITKAVNAVDPLHPTGYEDANVGPGPVLLAGSTVVWTYLVSNSGTTPIDVVGVQDDNGTGSADQGFVVDPVDVGDGHVVGDTNKNGLLDPGETWLFRATGVVPLGAYRNTATVTGVVVGEPVHTEVTPSDIANLFGTRGGIQVLKFLRDIRATDPASPVLVAAGSTARWTYAVTNTDKAPLANVVIVDDNGTPANPADDVAPTPVLAVGTAYNVGDANRDGLLDPTETWLYELSRTMVYGPYVNVVRVSGTLTTGTGTVTVWDDDLNYSLGVTPQITMVKAVNALDPFRPTPVEDANSQPAKELLVGTTATWTYVVRNTGNVAVVMSTIRDDNGTPTNAADDFTPTPVLAAGTSFNVGDVNRNGLLDMGEAWLFSATTVVRGGAYRNTATASVNEPITVQTASASDVAGYYGNSYGEGLTPGYWKNHPGSWPTWSDGTQVFRTDQIVGSVFTAAPEPNRSMTLFDALNEGGGNVDALLRHAIAALLSTGSQFISYPVSARWIIDQVNAALASGDPTRIENLKNQLMTWNQYEANLTPPTLTTTTTTTTTSTTTTSTTQMLLAATTSPTPTSSLTVTDATLRTVAEAAAAQWVSAGAPADLLTRVTFVVTDLPPGVLAQTVGSVVYVDRDAAGFGWYSSTAGSLFTSTNAAGDLVAKKGSLADGRVDLLSVLLHELGHAAGLTHEAVGTGRVMLATLPAGVRRALPVDYRLP